MVYTDISCAEPSSFGKLNVFDNGARDQRRAKIRKQLSAKTGGAAIRGNLA